MTENALCSAAISSETGGINAWKGRRHAICCKTAPGIFWSCGLSQPYIVASFVVWGLLWHLAAS